MAKLLANTLTGICNSDCYAHFSLKVIKVKQQNPCKCFVISKTGISGGRKLKDEFMGKMREGSASPA